MTRGLTARQAQVLEFIQDFTHGNGYPPTVREVAANFGFRSPRAAHDHMKALEKKGYMRSRAGRPRALEILQSRRGIPLLGKIAAGKPILAVEDAEEVLGLEPNFFGQGRFFALRVRGDSMIEDHIAEGDLVILKAQADARSGEVAAVLLGDEVTLKRVVPGKKGVELKASNPAVKDILVSPSDDPPRVLGVMVGLVRKN